MGELMQASEHFVVAVAHHDGAQSQAHCQQGKRLKTIEIAHNTSERSRVHHNQPNAKVLHANAVVQLEKSDLYQGFASAMPPK
jgi:hypothetical protein